MTRERPDVLEQAFMDRVMVAIGARDDVRCWRQNCGVIAVRDERGDIMRVFRAGPPKGASDISGIVRPEGWRLEIECKGGRGKRTPAQLQWAEFIRASGGVYLLATYDDDAGMPGSVALAVEALDDAIHERRSTR